VGFGRNDDFRNEARFSATCLGTTASARQTGPKREAIVGGVIADHMQADRFVRMELRTLRAAL
jgi:hypothetical protein